MPDDVSYRKHGKHILIPEDLIRTATPYSVIVKETDFGTSPIALALLPGDRFSMENDYEVGEVVTFGSKVEEIERGTILLYKASHGYPVPNGVRHSKMFKIEYPFSVMAIVGHRS